MNQRLTSKGQVTVPKAVRDLLGLRPGSEVRFRRDAAGAVTIERADGQTPRSRFAQLRGVAGPGLSTDEIMALTRSAEES
jgi:AbrB family looped-hinge helix DNA binding protein